MDWLLVFDPLALLTVRLIVYMPGVLYITTGGVCPEYVFGTPPGKLHTQDVGEPVDASETFTTTGEHIPLATRLKFATGTCPCAMNTANRLIIVENSSFLFNGVVI